VKPFPEVLLLYERQYERIRPARGRGHHCLPVALQILADKSGVSALPSLMRGVCAGGSRRQAGKPYSTLGLPRW
jgi:hypothetical protein